MKLQLMLISPAGDPALRLSLHSSLFALGLSAVSVGRFGDPSSASPSVSVDRQGDLSTATPPVSVDRQGDLSTATPPVRSARLCAWQQALWWPPRSMCEQQQALCVQQHEMCGWQHDMWCPPRGSCAQQQALCARQHDMWWPPHGRFHG
jgi:hypothetical protein